MIVFVLVCKGKMLLSILMGSVMCLRQVYIVIYKEKDILDHAHVKCHFVNNVINL